MPTKLITWLPYKFFPIFFPKYFKDIALHFINVNTSYKQPTIYQFFVFTLSNPNVWCFVPLKFFCCVFSAFLVTLANFQYSKFFFFFGWRNLLNARTLAVKTLNFPSYRKRLKSVSRNEKPPVISDVTSAYSH